MKSLNSSHRLRRAGLAVVSALTLVAAVACADDAGEAGNVTITLAGPNQWNSSGSSFGKPWEDLVAAFERKEPGIKVKTVVLPLDQFSQTISTQLAAGTAPELVFNQAAHQPYMVHALDDYLNKPNPYVDGNMKWIDLFRQKFYGPGLNLNAEGHQEFIPFNLFGAGLFYNKDVFAKAGVTVPVPDFAALIDACGKLKAAGYTPMAMDTSELAPVWTLRTINNMLTTKYFKQWNAYAADGKPGTSETLSLKSQVRAVLTGDFLPTKTPEVAETMRLLKNLWDSCADKNWSGITGNSGAVVGLREFASGKAAFTWGANFGVGTMTEAAFPVGSMPFPTITTASSPLADDTPAQFGASPGGTSYMIPSTVKDAKLDAAIKFLQFASAPEYISPWLKASGGIPAVEGAQTSEAVNAFGEGTWGEPMKMAFPETPAGVTLLSLVDGYLLGTKSMDQELKQLEQSWIKAANEAVKKNNWGSEDWAK